MADFEIICTTQTQCSARTGHIVNVGLSGFVPTQYSVQDIYNAMDAGDRFYTNAAGAAAWVHKFSCSFCGRPTLRTDPDVTAANNLDSLPMC